MSPTSDKLWKCIQVPKHCPIQKRKCNPFLEKYRQTRSASNQVLGNFNEKTDASIKTVDPNILYSHVPDIHIRPTHFSSLVWSSVNTSPISQFRTALVNGDNGRSFSYKESFTLTKKFASALAKFGAERGDVLALILPNQPEFVFVFTGAPMVGVTVTTISPGFTYFEMKHQLTSSEPVG